MNKDTVELKEEKTKLWKSVLFFLVLLALLPLGIAFCSEGAYAAELDFTLSEKITMTADGSKPDLNISTLVIHNNSADLFISVDKIEVSGGDESWRIVPDDTDFINMASNMHQFSLTVENHDFYYGAFTPSAMELRPNGSVEVGLDGKTGISTDAVEDMQIGYLAVTISPLGSVIPEGCTYTIYNTGEVRYEGELMPAEAEKGDIFTSRDYKYTNQIGGWKASVIDTSKTSYEALLTNIASVPLTSLYGTFQNCSLLEEAPEIPDSIENIGSAFRGCASLKTAPVLPPGITSMSYTFYGCRSLQTAPEIPQEVTDMPYTFYNCTSLEEAPVLPPKAESLKYTFQSCKKLKTAPVIPDSVTDMTGTFGNCILITEAPEIPNGVENMKSAFQSCKALKYVPNLPDSVTNMYYTFHGCSSLETVPDLPDGVEDLYGTFYLCSSLKTAPKVPASVTDISYTFYGCSEMEGDVTVDAEPSAYDNCFGLTEKPLVIMGSCSDELKEQLAATAEEGNVSWI